MTENKRVGTTATVNSLESTTTSQGEVADGWSEVSELANKMEEQAAADLDRQELLDFAESLDLDKNYDSEEELALNAEWETFLKKMSAGNYWHDKEIVGKLAQRFEAAPYELCQFGMPAEVILEDKEYYSEMIKDDYYGLGLGDIGSFYKIMSQTPEGKAQFRKDFVDGKNLDYRMTMWLGKAFRGEDCSEAELNGLKAFKESGVSLISRTDWLCSEYGPDPFHDTDYQSKNRALGAQFASFLLANGLFDSEDAGEAYEKALKTPADNAVIGVVDVALRAKIPIPEDSSEDAKYWHKLSLASGTNQIADFLEKDFYHIGKWAERIQQDYDFTAAPVQRLFARDQAHNSGVYDVGNFTSPKFLNALKDQGFQTIIMDAIEDWRSADLPYRDIHRDTPMLFLLLAQDRTILDDMQSRGVFQNYPNCETIDVIGKLAKREFTEKDRLSLFIGSRTSHSIDEFFDENGEPNQLLINELCKELGSHYGSKLSLRLPSLRFLDEKSLDRMHKYWQERFNAGNYDPLASCSSWVIKQMELGDTETQFILGISKNDLLQGKPINEDDILATLTRFIKMDANDWLSANESDLLIKEAFGGNEVKNLALEKIREVYEAYIAGDSNTEIPAGIKALYEYMVQHDGAGPLTQIESLLSFVGNIASAGEEGRKFTREIEQKMDKAHWTNQEKTNFYAISAEVLQADPGLYLEFAELFANIPDKKDFETFVTDIYPLFRAKLALLRKYEDHSNGIGSGYTTVSYDVSEIDEIKNQLHNALLPFNLQELSPEKRRSGINIVRSTMLGEISELFQVKFGFLPGAAPANFSKSDTKALEDMTLYLSNIATPTEHNKDIIGFFLALQFDKNDAWDKMRSGEDVPPGKYLNVVSSFNVSEAIRISRENNPVNAENTRIQSPDKLQAFRTELQKETITRRLGNAQTIDLKFQNLIGNIEELTDPDLYPDKMDKDRASLLGRHPVKTIGKVAAIMHQRMNGRNVPYGRGEESVAGEITQILQDNGVELTSDNIKNYFQSGLSGLKEPFGIMANIQQEGVPQKIQELQTMLIPPDEIVQIFSKLGEDFKPQSGAMALSSDLDYLENLIVKHDKQLREEELSAAREYINTIRSKMAELNSVFDKTVQNFRKMSKSVHENAPAGVKSKVRDIEKIIGGAESEQVIVTTCTTSMTTIVENMRACLSCKTKGINNDTDLTFGEGYKFYLYSTTGATRNDSNTDEIVYFVPVGEGESRRMGFVMDQMYGTKNSDIMVSHLENVLKKARSLKEQFPEVPISIILPNSSMHSCGVEMSAEELSQKLEPKDGLTFLAFEGETVTVPKSGFGDHYIEFGGDARTSGSRAVNGIEIVL